MKILTLTEKILFLLNAFFKQVWLIVFLCVLLLFQCKFDSWLYLISYILLLSCVYLFIYQHSFRVLKRFVLCGSIIIFLIFIYSNCFYLFINPYHNWFSVHHITITIIFTFFQYNICYNVFSFLLIWLTLFLLVICILCSWSNIFYKIWFFFFLLLLINFFLVSLFLTTNLFIFYLFFEGLLIPMVLLIGLWGTRKRKIYAIFLFFFYTFIGSLAILFVIIFFYLKFKTLDYFFLLSLPISINEQQLCWILLFIAFSIKVPIFPFHIWLPEAHVEAPTVGSIILAGVILKLGIYAFIIFLFPLLPLATYTLVIYIQLIGVISVFLMSCLIVRQIDLKKIIAYSSIIHMNYVLCSLFSLTLSSVVGSIIFLISHGLISSSLFFSIGCLYDRYGTRNIKLLAGYSIMMPIYSLFFFICNIANMSFPGFISFSSEFLMLLGLGLFNKTILFSLLIFIILTGLYSVWLINRILFGWSRFNYNIFWSDLQKREIYVFVIFSSLIILYGIFPNILIYNLTYFVNEYCWYLFN